jgi:lipopolysaccharide/colanic/teichoic acid biosynthesis glycosyltransferase
MRSLPFLPPAVAGLSQRLRAETTRTLTTLRREAADALSPALRRGIDIAVGAGGLLAASPVLAAAALAVKLTSPGPILYAQTRIGQHGRPFRMLKVRTMFVDADRRLASLQHLNESHGGVTFKIRRDPRVTPVGRVLRKLSLDELPQLWNVFEGEMTLFGPRPPLPREVARYSPRERRRLEVKPGLTCLWQVSGRSDLSFEEQVALDLTYIDTSTPRDEAWILARTLPAVLGGRGAY